MFKQKEFIGIWLMFFLNIHCGLMIISYEKQILNTAFATSAFLPLLISIIPSITAGANALGRIGYSTLSDKLKERNYVYGGIFISCILIASVKSKSQPITVYFKFCLPITIWHVS